MSNSTPRTVQESGGEPQRAAVPSLLVIYARDHARVGHRMAIDGSMAIGRLTTGFGGLPFTDPRMSRDHVQIHVEGDELLLIDGGSTNGTLLNDRPIRQAAMREGDVVQIGTTFFHYGRHAPQPRAVPGSWLTGVDAHSEALRRELSVVAPTGITVLIDGELGSGKRTAARELHRLSGRTGSLITVECAASSSEEVERRLFGDEQEGPVVGPPSAESALLESTDSTLLLADIDRLSIRAQVRLFWALEQRARSLDPSARLPRLICTTSRDLEQAVQAGSFRADLRQKLGAWRVELPPLRARLPDVGALLAQFVERFTTTHGLPALYADPTLVWRLLGHDWSGNVAELASVVDAACAEVIASDGVLRETPRLSRLLEPRAQRGGLDSVASRGAAAAPTTLDEFAATLERYDYVIAHVARHYGKHRQQVYRWLDRFGIDLEALKVQRARA